MAEELINSAHKPDYPRAPDGGQKPLRGDPITGERYYSKDFAHKEWERMWTRVWHIAAREAEMPDPGDFVRHDFLRESVVAVRDANSHVRVFYNTCMHRGQRLAHGDAGSVAHFTCAYHGWKWGLDGRLLDVQDPDDFEDGSPCGKLTLVEVPSATWGGFVWYSMDPNAPPLLDFLDPIPSLLEHRGMDDMHRVVRLKIRVNTNWKFAPDNFNESYHLPTVHPQMRSMIDEDFRNTIFEMYPAGHNRMIEQGQPSLRADQPNQVEPVWADLLSEWDLNPDDFAGRARDGRLALQQAKRTLGAARGYDYFDRLYDDELTDYFHHTLFPNVTITGFPDGVHVFRTEPDPMDPEWCTFDYWCLMPAIRGRDQAATIYGMRPYAEAELEYTEYGSARYGHYLGDFIDQDLSIAVTQQQGFHSRAYRDANLSGQESRVRRFHEVLNDYLEGRR